MEKEKYLEAIKEFHTQKESLQKEIKKLEDKIIEYKKCRKSYPVAIFLSLLVIAFAIVLFLYEPLQNFVGINPENQFWSLVIAYLQLCLIQAVITGFASFSGFWRGVGGIFSMIVVMLIAGVFSLGILMLPAGPFFLYLSNGKSGGEKLDKELTEKQEKLSQIDFEINKNENAIKELEEKEQKAENLYLQAIENNNDRELMQQAADLGHDKAQAFIEAELEKEAERASEELYLSAFKDGGIDRKTMEAAASLGHKKANIEIAKFLIDDYISDEFTNSEKENIIKKAAECLDKTIDGNTDVLVEFLWLFSNSMCNWVYDYKQRNKALSRIREIKNSGELQEKYQNIATACIATLISLIDKTGRFKEEPKANNTQEVRFDSSGVVCRYFANGICGYKSGSAIIEHCYRDDGTWKVCPYYKNRVY